MAIQSSLAELVTYSPGTSLIYRSMLEVLWGHEILACLNSGGAKIMFRSCSLFLSQLMSTKERYLNLFFALFSIVAFALLSSDRDGC